jgi:hypothetical protein
MFLYNLSQTKLTKFRRYIDDVLTKNWIKHFISLVDVSILFVFKKNDDFKLCVNYKKFNAVTIKNRHFLFFIIETFNRLNDVKKFIKLNLKNVYHRIRIKRDNEWKTTFRTRYDHFEYQILFFEFVNASTIFQTYINQILKNLIDVICVIYLNDILIFNNKSTKHWRHVKIMFERFRTYELYVNLKKCEFVIKQIEFLNFIIFIDEINMNTKRMRTIEKWFQFKTYREIQICLNFVYFYKQFVYHYFHIVVFFIDLLKKIKTKNLNRLNNHLKLRKRFVNSNKFLQLRFYFIIMIHFKKFASKQTFSYSTLLLFFRNRMKMNIDVRWRFDREN